MCFYTVCTITSKTKIGGMKTHTLIFSTFAGITQLDLILTLAGGKALFVHVMNNVSNTNRKGVTD